MYKLRELQYRDLSTINQWRNNKDLIDLLGAPFRFININVDEDWYNNYLSNRDTNVRCSIVDENDHLFGLVSITSINTINQTAEFHVMLGDLNNCGKGIGTFAVSEMISHAFYNLNLRRIELAVLADNLRAQHVYEKVGFVCEGTKRKAVFKNGRFVDLKLYAILREEYSGEGICQF
ncbi:Protein N-acetyltransferase, RimJ/RimL family [Ruminococcaceae bacterium P7]|nr:Protein N-acetyltransferase, RimJ/RimL family [Ruminococcaceae bacterium P7]